MVESKKEEKTLGLVRKCIVLFSASDGATPHLTQDYSL